MVTLVLNLRRQALELLHGFELNGDQLNVVGDLRRLGRLGAKRLGGVKPQAQGDQHRAR